MVTAGPIPGMRFALRHAGQRPGPVGTGPGTEVRPGCHVRPVAPPRRSMPGSPVPCCRRTGPLAGAAIALGLIVALGWAGSAVAQTPTQARQATLTAEVPAGQFRGLRLRNVPRNARIAIAARATLRNPPAPMHEM
jgi:hypothetical protein